MKITLGNKINITFFINTLTREIIIHSERYGINIYRKIIWHRLEPWVAYRGNIYINKNIKTIHPLLIHKHIFVKPSSDDPLKNLPHFLKELSEQYDISGEIIK